MEYKKILDILTEIESQLDDAVNTLPEYNSNVDTRSYIDGARCDLYVLKDDIERSILDSNKKDIPGFEGTTEQLINL